MNVTKEPGAAGGASLREDALGRAVARARARWPGIRSSVEDLAEHVGRLDRVGDIERFGDELYLACAGCRRDTTALRVLERDYVPRTAPTFSRFRCGADFTDEAQQILRQKLLLLPDQRLARYSATGPLLGWLRVVALRLALDMKRGAAPARDEELGDVVAPRQIADSTDVERYRATIAEALRAALASMSPEERTLLRLHHLDGLSLDQLAVLNKVHRATVARRLADLRARILAAAKFEVAARHRLTRSELGSLFRIALPELDASSLFRLVAPAGR